MRKPKTNRELERFLYNLWAITSWLIVLFGSVFIFYVLFGYFDGTIELRF